MVPLILEKIYFKKLKPTIDKPLMKNLLNLPFISKILKNKICEKLTQSFGGNFHVVIVGGSALNEEVEKFLMDIGFKFTVGFASPFFHSSPILKSFSDFTFLNNHHNTSSLGTPLNHYKK